MIMRRWVRLIGISLLMGAGGGCGAQPDAESIGRSEAALGGTGTYLYLFCNTTSYNPNDLSRMVGG